MNPVKPKRFATLVYHLMVLSSPLTRFPLTGTVWNFFWRKSIEHFSGPVRTTIHGFEALVNFGYTYPVFARMYPSLNNPLVELVHQCNTCLGRPVNLIDVGAAVGDTVFLLQRNCQGMIGTFYCVDGDPEFYRYLVRNLSPFSQGKCIHAMVSDNEGEERSLKRIHLGTASALGPEKTPATTLDNLFPEVSDTPIDILKIDIDGFDGKALAGARRLLQVACPAVIFEWHPILCKQTGNDWMDHFIVLSECGYTRFLWFTKYGEFSHFMYEIDRHAIDRLAEACHEERHHPDWHYDVIALPRHDTMNEHSLAEMAFAKNRKSRY